MFSETIPDFTLSKLFSLFRSFTMSDWPWQKNNRKCRNKSQVNWRSISICSRCNKENFRNWTRGQCLLQSPQFVPGSQSGLLWYQRNNWAESEKSFGNPWRTLKTWCSETPFLWKVCRSCSWGKNTKIS